MPTPLYVFDMDETLLDGDCAMIWNEFLVEKSIAIDLDFLKKDHQLMKLYARGKMNMQDYLTFSMAPLLNLSTEKVAMLVDECVEEKILPRIFPQAVRLIEQLNQKKIQMIVISASVSFLITAIAKKMGIKHAIGIDLVKTDHGYTADILGVASYREGKVTRLTQWLEAQQEQFSEVHFYTDSINDLPLCQHADYCYLVNPCDQLLRHANQDNWQQLNWFR